MQLIFNSESGWERIAVRRWREMWKGFVQILRFVILINSSRGFLVVAKFCNEEVFWKRQFFDDLIFERTQMIYAQ